MALWNNFPYSNVHELNLNWIIEKMKYLIDQWESYGTTVDADAVAGLAPAVTVMRRNRRRHEGNCLCG